MVTHDGAIRQALRPPQRRATLILLSSTVLMLTWRYFASPDFLAGRLAGHGSDGRVAGAIGSFVASFVLLGVIPAAVVKLLLRERLADYGLRGSMTWKTWAAAAQLVPLFILVAYGASRTPAILEKFPINPRATDSATLFALHAATYLLFYVGWEFHFRGFLLCGLRPTIGDANAILVQTMASALLHIGSPAGETFGAIAAGLLWGLLAIRTGSLLPGLVQHFLLGIALDVFIAWR